MIDLIFSLTQSMSKFFLTFWWDPWLSSCCTTEIELFFVWDCKMLMHLLFICSIYLLSLTISTWYASSTSSTSSTSWDNIALSFLLAYHSLRKWEADEAGKSLSSRTFALPDVARCIAVICSSAAWYRNDDAFPKLPSCPRPARATAKWRQSRLISACSKDSIQQAPHALYRGGETCVLYDEGLITASPALGPAGR